MKTLTLPFSETVLIEMIVSLGNITCCVIYLADLWGGGARACPANRYWLIHLLYIYYFTNIISMSKNIVAFADSFSIEWSQLKRLYDKKDYFWGV